MKGFRILRGLAVSLACWGIVFPQSQLLAAAPTNQVRATPAVQPTPPEPQQRASKAKRTVRSVKRPQVVDVELAAGGTVTGMVIDAHGQRLEGALVSVRTAEGEVAKAVTDRSGGFSVSNLRGGVYHVAAAQGHGIFRFWAPQTAPPSARAQALVVSDDTVVRGQSEVCPYCGGQGCPECSEVEYVEYVEEGGYGGGFLGLDVITLALLGVTITSLVLLIDLKDDIKDLRRRIDRIRIPVSP